MREAVESYAADVRQVADELARASDVATFAAALRELVELAAVDRVFVADEGGALIVGSEAATFRLGVEAT